MSNMVVQTNVLALNSHRYMKQVGNAQSKSSARLSSGYKINSAADDAAGLAISEKMRAQIRGLDQASKNAQDGISLIQTAEGGMQEIDNMLQRIRELVVSVSNDTNENNTLGTGDRQKMQDEIDQLVAEIDSMSERVEFNKKKVINGSYADTALQLRNAKAEYDRSSLAKVETNAKLSAYKEALGATDDQSSATGTTAYSRLNYAQENVDAEVPTYTAALKAYTAAEVTYTEAQSAYQTARQTMEDQLSKANKSASEITDAMLDKSNAVANFGKDFDFDSFARAFTAYQEASNTWGVEELGFVDKTTGLSNILDTNVLTKTAFTGFASADAALAAAKGAQATYDAALAAALEDPVAADYLALDADTAKLTAYNTAKDALTSDAKYAQGAITGTDITGDSAFAAKLEAYVKAADAYGVDELDLANEPYFTEIGLTPALKSDISSLADLNSETGFAAVYENLNGADADDTLAAVTAYLSSATASGLKSTYDGAVTALNTAIAGVAGLDFGGGGSTITAGNAATNALADAINKYMAAAEAYGVDGEDIATTVTFGSDGDDLATVKTLLDTFGAAGQTTMITSATTTAPAVGSETGAAALYAAVEAASGSAANADADILAVKTANTGKTYGTDDMATVKSDYDAAVGSLPATIDQMTNDLINADTDIAAYVTAAKAWGVDGEALKADLTYFNDITVDNKYKPTVTDDAADNPTMAAAAYAALPQTSADLVDAVAAAKAALDKLGEYGKFQVEKETFTAAEAKYTDLVAKRDTAQATVNTLTNSVESTEKEKTRTDMLYNVANAKLDTAKNAVEADDSQALYFQVGANAMQGLEMSIGSVKSDVLGIGDGKGVTNIDVVKDTGLDTTALLDVLDTALSYVTTERSRLGAAQNRLEYTIKSLDISSENLSAAESRIRDTDMAKEMMELTKANTLQQASISMLAQANQAPQSVLQLLG